MNWLVLAFMLVSLYVLCRFWLAKNPDIHLLILVVVIISAICIPLAFVEFDKIKTSFFAMFQ